MFFFLFCCSTHSQIETNQPCGKSLKKLLRSGIRKGNGTSIEGRSKVGSSTETQKARLSVVGKTLKRRPASGLIQERENKKRRRKYKGRRRERMMAKEERLKKKEKHERRKGAGRV